MVPSYAIRGVLACCSILLSACGDSGSDNPPEANGLSYPAGVQRLAAPQYSCGAPGAITQEVMQDLNRFWQSSVFACACSFDAPPVCFGGAFVGSDPGYIYYDVRAMDQLDQITGSRLPADMVMAHEFGHSVQVWLGLQSFGKQRELQADCLSGYYLGSRVRRGLASQSDLASTFAVACSYGDPYLAPWFEPGAHGVCQERVAALNQGIAGNLSGYLPGQTCP